MDFTRYETCSVDCVGVDNIKNSLCFEVVVCVDQVVQPF